MVDHIVIGKARTLRDLHAKPVLVLPNAWDAAAAALFARAGAAAVATTSGGVAWSLGRPDGEGLTRLEMAAAVRRIAGAVDVPVTADVEGGYGPSPADVAATTHAVIEAGAVGLNIEDSWPGGAMRSADAQAERIRAARDAAAEAGLPDFVINARTDVYLLGDGDGHPGDRLGDVLARAAAYAAAGADCLFVPGLLDLPTLGELATASPLPVNAMTGPGGPSVADLAAAGIRRISVGTAIAQAAYATAECAAREMLGTGTFDALADGVSYPGLNALWKR